MRPNHEHKRVMVLAIDLVGFSAVSELDEAAAVHHLQAFHSRVRDLAAVHGGRVFSTAGDGVLLEFGDASAGVQAAVALVKRGPAGNDGLNLRAGGDFGDVIEAQGGDLFGAAVNVAARLCSQATTNELLVSDAVKAQIRGDLGSSFAPHGHVTVNKAKDPIVAHKFVGGGLNSNSRAISSRVIAVGRKRWRMLAGGAIVLGLAALFVWAVVALSRAPPIDVVAWIETHPGTAAWVQAVGSLLALITALALPYLQRRTLERSRAQKVRPIVMDMWNAARDAYYFCIECDESLTRGAVAEQLTRARCAFEDCPTHELRETAIVHLFRARDRIIQLERRFENPDEDLRATKVPATVRAICLAIIDAMEAESALSAPQQVRVLMTKLAEDTGLERRDLAGVYRA